MQRILTIIVFVVLFAIGAVILAGGAVGTATTYGVPSDPVLAIVLVGAIIAVLVLTLVVGFGLARSFGLISSQLGVKLNADDRPEIEKRALGLVDRSGKVLGSVLSKVGYGESVAVKPYTPGYSYKADPERVETRQFLIGFGVVMLLLVGYAVVSQWQKWMVELRETDPTVLAVGAGSIVAIVGLTGALGFGLSFWFYRTVEEKDKTARLKEPAWPAAELVVLEQRVRRAPQTIKEMTFLDKSLIGLNVGLVAILLGAVGVWVVPGMLTVAQLDRVLNPWPTEAPPEVASLVPPDLQKEIDALPPGDAARGKAGFNGQACHVCHVDQPLGPPMPGDPPIGVRAAARKPGFAATAYLYESITLPNAYLVPGFPEGRMPPNFKTLLKPQEIADLIAYLESLK